MSNISRSKDNHTVKCGQLIEHTMRNTFLAKSCTKCGEEAIFRAFLKIYIYISPNQWSKVLYSLFVCLFVFAKLRAIKIYWNQAQDHLLSPQIKLIWKAKSGLELVSCVIFCMAFEKKCFSWHYINWQNFFYFVWC